MLPDEKGFVVLGSVGSVSSEHVRWVVCGFTSLEKARGYAKVCSEAVGRARSSVVHVDDFHESYHPEIQGLLDKLEGVDPGVVSEDNFLPIAWRSTPTYEAVEVPWGS